MSVVKQSGSALDFFEHLIDEHGVEVIAVRLTKVGCWEIEVIFPKMGDWGRDLLLSGVASTFLGALEAALAPMTTKNDENVSGSVKNDGN